MDAWLRVLNHKTIQPNQQPTEPSSLASRKQSYINHPTVSPTHLTELIVASLVILIPFSVHAGIFSDLFSSPTTSTVEASEIILDNPTDLTLLSATQNPDPHSEENDSEVVIDETAIVATAPVSEAERASAHKDNNGEISVYTVREGDSLSQVAEMFGVTANTILWANDLNKSTGIQPGQSLVILPVVGVRHVVKSGDSLSTIAKKYEADADEILAFNQLESASGISVGNTLIIPGGEIHADVETTKTKKGVGKNVAKGTGGGGFINPAPGAVKSQGIHGYNGVDLAGGMGSTIRAAAGGTVIVAKGDGGWNGGYGNYIVIKHNNGTQTLYAHLSSLSVGAGATVDQGETIGGMGNSGKSTGTHLHFEVRGGRNPF